MTGVWHRPASIARAKAARIGIMTDDVFLIGDGAGFSGDRLDAPGPVVDTLIASGRPAAMMFEVLAERTLALAQPARRADPETGYEPMLEPLIRPLLKRDAAKNGRPSG